MRIRLQRSMFGDSQQPVITAVGEFTRRDFGLVYQARPRFLDRAISSSVGVKVRLEVASAAATEGIGR